MKRVECYLTGFLLLLNAEVGSAQETRKDLHGDPLPPGAIARLGTIRLRPGVPPHNLSFTSDSKQLICCAQQYGGNGNVLVYYSADTGKEMRRVELFHSRARAFRALPGGRGVALLEPVLGGRNFFMWEFSDPKARWPEPEGPPQSYSGSDIMSVYAISPDGRWLIGSRSRMAGEKEDLVHVWPWKSGRFLRELKPVYTWKIDDCSDLLFSNVGELLALSQKAGATDAQMRAFDLSTGKALWKTSLSSLPHLWGLGYATSPRQPVLAIGPASDHGRILDLATSKKLNTLDFPNRTEDNNVPRLSALSFGADGRFLAAGDEEGWLRWWDVAKKKTVWEVRGRKNDMRILAVSPDGSRLASAGADSQVRLWETATGKELNTVPAPASPPWQIEMSPDGRSVIYAGRDGKLGQWDLANGKLLQEIAFNGEYPCLGFQPGTDHLYVTHDERFERWRLDQNRYEPAGFGKQQSVKDWFRFSGDGKVLVSIHKDQVDVWNWTQKKIRRGWSLADAAKPDLLMETLEVDHTGKHVFMSAKNYLLKRIISTDEAIALWHAPTGLRIRDFLTDNREENRDNRFTFSHAASFTPDQQGLILGMAQSQEESLRWVDLANGQIRRKFLAPANLRNQHSRWSTHVAFSPDGRTIASAERDHTIILYEAASGLPRRVLEGHRGESSKVAFTPDGKRLVSFNSDLTGLVWDLRFSATLAKPPTPEQWQEAWGELLNVKDGLKVHEAMARLAALPKETTALFQKQLLPAPALDAQRIARLFADLDDGKFAVRDQAFNQLDKLGEDVLLPMREHLKKSPPLEVTRRLQRLIDKHDSAEPTALRLRELRALEILEQLATPEARKLLAALAGGAPSSRRTQDAIAALRRLDHLAKLTAQP